MTPAQFRGTRLKLGMSASEWGWACGLRGSDRNNKGRVNEWERGERPLSASAEILATIYAGWGQVPPWIMHLHREDEHAA